ncbi:MAG TPA: class I SAM-dependent methyltransferase [Candidatus Sulfotelmatobacter sp.]|nr:class I SAM-dependent methyltransferase [Candidatus Sulfotelmatobacter sp.]
MNPDQHIAEHYTRGMLEETILRALQNAGRNTDQLSSADLAPLDNLHLGGREAVEELSGFMALRPGMHLLDVGSGVGGPARYFAEHGCDVTGIDLTEEFVLTAESLTRKLNLDGKAKFRQGSALEMPFASGTFDGGYMIHVGMNIEDKPRLFREVARVLKPGARFAIFDIMRVGDHPLEFPVPWATQPHTSFVATVEEYRYALAAAGLRVEHVRDRRQVSIEFMEKMRAQAAAGAREILGVHLLMGEHAPLMLKNVNGAIYAGKLVPVELVAIAG